MYDGIENRAEHDTTSTSELKALHNNGVFETQVWDYGKTSVWDILGSVMRSHGCVLCVSPGEAGGRDEFHVNHLILHLGIWIDRRAG